MPPGVGWAIKAFTDPLARQSREGLDVRQLFTYSRVTCSHLRLSDTRRHAGSGTLETQCLGKAVCDGSVIFSRQGVYSAHEV